MRDTIRAVAVALAGLHKVYPGGAVAVEDVSLEIREGEFFSLLGPSGCGKTTTLRMIAGFEEPTSGSIRLSGEDVTWLPPHRRELGLVFQNYALFPHRTVAQNIAFGLRMRRLPKDEIDRRVAAALAQVQLEGLGDRYPSQLSGGQQQRVALARATVIRPRVLLCDEPLGALDRKLRTAMQFELKELQRALGVTLIYVTHDQEEALTMSDRIAVMNRGRIEQVAPPAEIYDRPATSFVSGFIGEATLFTGQVRPREDGGLDLLGEKNLRLRLPPGIRRAQGTPITVAIRPERLSFAAEGLPGTVAEANYLGTATLFKVRLEVGVTALVRVPSGETSSRLPRAGEPVRVSVPETGLVAVAQS